MAIAPERKKVLLVDDHPIVRFGMAQLINGEDELFVCCEASNAQEAQERLRECRPDIMIVDVKMEGLSGFDLVHTARKHYPEMRSIVVSMYDEQVYAERAIKSGANGYIQKDHAPAQIIEAIHNVLAGKTYVSDALRSHLAHSVSHDGPHDATPAQVLSSKEFEIFQLIGQGLKKGQIAERIYRSVNTVETHRASIKRKLNVRTSAELYRLAFRAMEMK